MILLKNKIYRNDLQKGMENFCELENLRNKTILITGATGLIGSTIVDFLVLYNELYGTNIQILAAARSYTKVIERFGKNNNIMFVEYDALEDFRFLGEINYIIHGAGIASPGLYTQKPVETMLTTIYGTEKLLKYSYNSSVNAMVFISSSEVYGQKEAEGCYVENNYGKIDLDNIRNSYSESKRAAELLCKSYVVEYGVNVMIVRPGHIFGPTATQKDQRISSQFAYKVAKGLKLEMKSTGLQKRSYCYCVDCAIAILKVLLLGERGEAYNIANDDQIKIKDMAIAMAHFGNVSVHFKEATEEERIAFNPMDNSVLSNDKIKTLGYEQVTSFEVGVEHTVSILKSCLK